MDRLVVIPDAVADLCLASTLDINALIKYLSHGQIGAIGIC